MSNATSQLFVHSFLLLTFVEFAISVKSECELMCRPVPSGEKLAGCVYGSTSVWPTDCSIRPMRKNTSSGTLSNIALNYSSENSRKVIKLNIVFNDMKFKYFLLKYAEKRSSGSMCDSYNITSIRPETSLKISHNCIWTDSDSGTEMDIKYQSYNDKFEIINKGHYLFLLPSLYRIDELKTPVNKWELFLYIDLSDSKKVQAKWPVPPVHFGIKQYLLKIFYEDSASKFQVFETHYIPVSTQHNVQESYFFETDSLSGRFFFTIQMLHDNCSNSLCFMSTSPVFSIEDDDKSPLLLGVVSLMILLPGFLYICYSWRRFGTPPAHKVPVVLVIYKRTMDSHFRVIVALVMYLRKACHIRALIEDFDILSADSEDPSSWYQEAFTNVDAVMVVSSPHCVGSNKDKAYYNINPAALHILEEKSKDKSSSLKLFSVIVPYCTSKDIPKEARNLPMFRLPDELNSVLWFIRFGPNRSCFSKVEYLLFQSQISGGTCDYCTYGKFLREALVDAGDESRRLRAMLADEQIV